MECLKCNKNMFKAQIKGDVVGIGLYLTNKPKGVLESEKRTTVSCYVCPSCGHVELKADEPQIINI